MTGFPAPRFGQMTFTSVDAHGLAAGGWQVMHCDALDDREIEFLKERVDAVFAWPGPVPEIPTDAQRAALPRRLVYRAGPDVATAYWHTAPAGKDGSGRPGNIFAHVVLDRTPSDSADQLRPADLAASVHWLRPFGPEEVRATVLPTLDPVPGVATAGSTELLFLQGLVGRGGLLAVLLDGLRAALANGPPVVLGLVDVGTAFEWIAAIGRLMPPGTARHLHWSTLERAETLATAAVHFAVVPLEDIDSFSTGVVVLDESKNPMLGDLGGLPHRAANGVAVEVTPWSGMVYGVLGSGDPALARQVLEAQDVVAAEVGDRDLDPGWPMAVAVTAMPESVPDADDEAAQLAEAAMPLGRSVLVIERVARRLLERRLGTTAAEAWSGLQRLTPRDSDVLRDVAVRIYLERALADEEWLLRPGGVPVPAVTEGQYVPDSELLRHAHEALRWMEQVTSNDLDDPDRFAASAVRMVEFQHQAGLLNLAGDALGTDDVANRLLERVLVPIAIDPTRARSLVQAVGPVSPNVRYDLLIPIFQSLVRDSPYPPGRRLSLDLLTWLYPEPPPLPTVDMLEAEFSPLIGEIAAQATLVVADPSALRLTALWAELDSQKPSDARIASLASGPALTAPELERVVAQFGPDRVLGFLVSTLLAGTAKEVNGLVEELSAPAQGLRVLAGNSMQAHQVMMLVELWHDLGWWQARADERRSGLALKQLDRAERLLAFKSRMPRFGRDLWLSLAVAFVVDVICRGVPERPRDQLELLIIQGGVNGGMPAETVNMLWAVLENRAISDEDTAVAALYGTKEPLPGPLANRRHILSQFTLSADQRPVLDAVMRLRAQRGRLPIPDLRERVRRRIHDEIHAVVPDRHEAKRLWVEHDAFADQWWQQLIAPPRRA